MSKVAVKSELFRWARQRSGLSLAALAQRFPKYEEWENGSLQPTLRQLEELAHKTRTPLGCFFLPEPPADTLPIPDFRTVKDAPVLRPSPDLLETVEMMQRRQEWLREFLVEEGQPALPFIGSANLGEQPEAIANHMRQTLGMAEEWAGRLGSWTGALLEFRRNVERVGIVVVINGVVGNNVYRKLDPAEFRGFVLSDPLSPLIFVNGADAKSAQMFTLAHELAHLWLGRGGVINLEAMQPVENEVEIFCNRVAAELLVPARKLRAAWGEAEQGEHPFQALARRFKVSPIVAARRTLDLGLIAKRDFIEFYRAYQEEEAEHRSMVAQSSGGDFYATQEVRLGRRFAEAVVRAAREGRLLYRDAYHLTGLFGQTFDRFAQGLGAMGS